MKVHEAEQLIKNIDSTVEALNKITAFDSRYDDLHTVLESAEVGMSWKSIALTSVNNLCAYKNVLKERIKNAELPNI